MSLRNGEGRNVEAIRRAALKIAPAGERADIFKPTRIKPQAVIGRDRLQWRGDVLHLGGGRELVRVVADPVWSGMYRVRFRDGRTTDMVNKTRAKDASETLALAILADLEAQASPREARPCVETAGGRP